MRIINALMIVAAFQCVLATANAAQSPQQASSFCFGGRVVSEDSAAGHGPEIIVALRGGTYDQQTNITMGDSFSFCNVPRGDLSLEVTAPGFKFWRRSLSNWSAFAIDSNITIVLEPTSQPAVSRKGPLNVNVKALRVPDKARREHERFLRYAAKADWERSLESLQKAVEAYPDYFDAWNNMGVVLSKLGRDPQAEVSFRRAIEIDPDSPAARRNLGHFCLVRGRTTEAKAELERAASINPRDGLAHAYLGYLMNETGRLAQAEEHLKRALALEPEMPLALHQLGLLNLRLNRPQAALHWFELFLKHARNSPASEEVRVLVARLAATP